MNYSFKQISAILISGALMMVLFQNCSNVDFSASDAETIEIDSDNDGQGDETKRIFSQNVKHTPGEVFPKVDILFVVDESVSMNAVLTQFQEGFASLDESVFPKETQIGFTNMAPAQIDANGALNPSEAFVTNKNITELPGFLQLVSGDSIAQALASPNLSAAVKSRFSEPGCAPWFAPSDKNVNNVSCVQAASQIARIGTGVEAGVVSLSQLSEHMTSTDQKLFRDGAIANVIFVSDTHDPGQNYYGRANATAEIMPYSDLKESIMNNNPLIADLRFNGILPLPEVGNSLLDGLNTLGELANTAAEATGVTNEGLHGYSYLDYIKQSNGYALHIANSDWKTAVKSMIETVGTSQKPLLSLSEVCPIVTSISMDGVLLEDSKYTVVDATTVRIEIEGLAVKEYDFLVDCED